MGPLKIRRAGFASGKKRHLTPGNTKNALTNTEISVRGLKRYLIQADLLEFVSGRSFAPKFLRLGSDPFLRPGSAYSNS